MCAKCAFDWLQCFNPLLPGVSFLYPLKTSENLWNSDVFRGYNKGTPGFNGIDFFTIWFFFHDYSRFARQQDKGEAISLTPLYHSHSLHRHLDISLVITAESSPLLTSTTTFIIFWLFWCFNKFSFHHRWNDARLFLITMVCTSYLTSGQTKEIRKYQESVYTP